MVVGSSFTGAEGNTSAITSADGFGVTIEGNGFGKVCCGITCGTVGNEFCFTATVGKDM